MLVAFLFWLVILGVLTTLSWALHFNGNEAASFLMPQTIPEMILWVMLAATAGFCEELVFRGYLQRQCLALTQNVAAAVIFAGCDFRDGARLSGGERRRRDFDLRDDVWGARGDAQELAPWHDAARDGGRRFRNRLPFCFETPPFAAHPLLVWPGMLSWRRKVPVALGATRLLKKEQIPRFAPFLRQGRRDDSRTSVAANRYILYRPRSSSLRFSSHLRNSSLELFSAVRPATFELFRT